MRVPGRVVACKPRLGRLFWGPVRVTAWPVLRYIRPMGMLREFAAAAAAALAGMCLAIALQGPPPQSDLPRAPQNAAARKIAALARPKPLPPSAAHPAQDATHLPEHYLAAAPLAPQSLVADPALAGTLPGAVAERLISKVPASLAPYFDVYLYVSKSADGPWAQHLFFFKKNAAALSFEQSFPVSTGREEDEQYFTATPTGLFELDVGRFEPMAYSAKWNDAAMPWAMFLNFSYRTAMTGVALHAAIGAKELANIGHRASGGCVRLPLDKADALFHRFQGEEKGQVPVFAFDEARGTTNVDGTVAGDADGRIFLADGVRVLVVIEDYPGDSPRPQS